MIRRILIPCALLIAFGLVGCGNATESTDTTGATTATTPGGAATTTTSDIESTTTTITFPQLLVELGLPVIEQHTPVSGGGTRPLLEWSGVDGAAHYYVAVLAPSGEPYWAWRTSETSVPVGGHPVLEDGAFGPEIAEGMTWSVSAVDGEGNLVGLSAMRPISP